MQVSCDSPDTSLINHATSRTATFTQRILTLTALKTTARFYGHPGPFTRILSRWHLVKMGPFVDPNEATTMSFIARNTSIPVPKVFCSFTHKKRTYIVMERVKGLPIHVVWGKASETARSELLVRLRSMIKELRALQPPRADVGVENCAGGSLQDGRIPHCQTRFGPFKTIQDFHSFLRQELSLAEIAEREDEGDWTAIKKMIVQQEGDWPTPIFTHGDLNPFNILVDGNKISSIIDWEFSGWYPCYWEDTSAWYTNRIRPYWQALLPEFMDAYPEELDMDIVRQKWWGDF